jgi:hypothetical protein
MFIFGAFQTKSYKHAHISFFMSMFFRPSAREQLNGFSWKFTFVSFVVIPVRVKMRQLWRTLYMKTCTRFRAQLERNSLHTCWSERWFKRRLWRKMKHILYPIQFFIKSWGFQIIKQKVFYAVTSHLENRSTDFYQHLYWKSLHKFVKPKVSIYGLKI